MPKEYGLTEVEYDCEQNDNTIRIQTDYEPDGEWIEEISIGKKDDPSGGWTIIGAEDLITALAKAGYMCTIKRMKGD